MRNSVLSAAFIVVILLCVSGAFAQGNTADELLNTIVTKDTSLTVPAMQSGMSANDIRQIQERNKVYISVILLVGLVATLWLASKHLKERSDSDHHLVQTIGMILVVYGTIFIVVLSDSDQQLTGSVGIMGAIAGYLFGTMEKWKKEAK